MDLLAFARGPGLLIAVAVCVLGTAWRLVALLRLPARADRSPPREGAPPPLQAALRAIRRGLWPRREFRPAVVNGVLNGYVLHLGLALVVFGYAPHIGFVRRHLGWGWPALPDALFVLAAAATIVALLIAFVSRLDDPVRRLVSTADDWISWLVVALPMATGMAVIGEPSAALLAREKVVYATPIALHLLSVELLLVWFPFGKLMHGLLFAFSRGATGVRFAHRGVGA